MTPCLFVCFICFGTADVEAAPGSLNFFSATRKIEFEQMLFVYVGQLYLSSRPKTFSISIEYSSTLLNTAV